MKKYFFWTFSMLKPLNRFRFMESDKIVYGLRSKCSLCMKSVLFKCKYLNSKTYLKKIPVYWIFYVQNIIMILIPYVFFGKTDNLTLHTMHMTELQSIIILLFEYGILDKLNLWHNLLGAGDPIVTAIETKWSCWKYDQISFIAPWCLLQVIKPIAFLGEILQKAYRFFLFCFYKNKNLSSFEYNLRNFTILLSHFYNTILST